MSGARVRTMLSVLVLTALAGTGVLACPGRAFAEQCVGVNGMELISMGGETMSGKMDSCQAQQLVDAYGNAKDASGLAGALGAKWWPVGVVSGVFFASAWNNQVKVKNAAAAGRGIELILIHGVIIRARPQ